ncbi:PTS sugar transporter subunit IIB [Enterococcus sp.]|uniref:PTS sugar transporter subunit IIB n=1 Tax=Enterococcus sp. TaxID=35783 RepID=UPI000EC52E6C|nr:PTS sugar transporter subunit IIB [Enterococcus sp.]HAB96459.1 PTS mannose/fructose/sorbose transporter subunit IIB [Enterococcus sp.]
MGKITFARVDSRLIHGQIVTKWAKSSGANCIYIVDDVVKNDEFSRDIYVSSGKRYGFSVKVYGLDEVLKVWEDTQFENDKVFIIFKNIETAIKSMNAGLPLPCLNLGGIPKRKGTDFFIKNVALSDDELTDLKKIATEKSVPIYAQTVPDAAKKSIS